MERLRFRIWRSSLPVEETDYGLSKRLERVVTFDPKKTTLSGLRSAPLDVVDEEGFERRTSLFQELQGVMADLPHPRGWPRPTALTFRFGIWPVDDPATHPDAIPREAEDDLVSKWIARPKEQDLILIPQSENHPDDKCTLISAASV